MNVLKRLDVIFCLWIMSLSVREVTSSSLSKNDQTAVPSLLVACMKLLKRSAKCHVTYEGWKMLSECIFGNNVNLESVRLSTIYETLDCSAELENCPVPAAVVPPITQKAVVPPPIARPSAMIPSGPTASGKNPSGAAASGNKNWEGESEHWQDELAKPQDEAARRQSGLARPRDEQDERDEAGKVASGRAEQTAAGRGSLADADYTAPDGSQAMAGRGPRRPQVGPVALLLLLVIGGLLVAVVVFCCVWQRRRTSGVPEESPVAAASQPEAREDQPDDA